MTLTVCWSAKGGAGTTLVCAAWALDARKASVLVDVTDDIRLMLDVPAPAGQCLGDWFASDAPPNAVLDLALDLDPTTRLIPRGPAEIGRRSPRWTELGRWMAASNIEFVADVGLGPPPHGLVPPGSADGEPPRARSVLVTRACYVALSRATSLGERPDGIVLVDEPGHVLTAADISRSLRAPVIAKVAWDPGIARAIDSGLLLGRLPKSILRLSQRVA